MNNMRPDPTPLPAVSPPRSRQAPPPPKQRAAPAGDGLENGVEMQMYAPPAAFPRPEGMPDESTLPEAAGGKKLQREAKTYFANERTLLSWINSVTFLALTGITLMSALIETSAQKPATGLGLAMVVITVMFACYALFKYITRLKRLKQKSIEGFGDRIGPVVLTVTYCIVILVTGYEHHSRYNLLTLCSGLFAFSPGLGFMTTTV
jgi:uncharacterized membrane protein YidH (DUF202 family)